MTENLRFIDYLSSSLEGKDAETGQTLVQRIPEGMRPRHKVIEHEAIFPERFATPCPYALPDRSVVGALAAYQAAGSLIAQQQVRIPVLAEGEDGAFCDHVVA